MLAMMKHLHQDKLMKSFLTLAQKKNPNIDRDELENAIKSKRKPAKEDELFNPNAEEIRRDKVEI